MQIQVLGSTTASSLYLVGVDFVNIIIMVQVYESQKVLMGIW